MFGGKIAPALSALSPSTAVANRWRGLAYLGAGLCAYVLFALITLPAYWADWLLNRVSHNDVRILQSEGTLWNGSGNLVIQSAGQERMQTRIVWELQPLWLFTGKLQARLRSPDSNSPLNTTIRIGYHHLTLREVEATVPMSVLSAFNPAVELVAPSGRLQITAQQTTLTPAGLEGDAQLTWLGAGARMGGLSEIGDYRLVVNGRGATAELRVETLRGDVAVTAQGEWQAQGEGLLRLSGTVAPGGREQTLAPLLAMLNAQNNNGQYSWTLTSRFSPALLLGTTPAP
jgi:general secretion pathway protein N